MVLYLYGVQLFSVFMFFVVWADECSELNNTQQLSDWLSSAYSYLAMVDYPYPSEFLMPLPAYPIKEVSEYLQLPIIKYK